MPASTPAPAAPPPAWRLDGQVALVTGAAGQLGRQFAATLGAVGAHVVVADLDKAQVEAAAHTLAGQGMEATALVLDVAEPASVRDGFGRVERELGRLDILVNNAGVAVFTPFEDRTLDEFMRVMRVNAGGTFLCTQAAARLMRAGPPGGRIINIGSIYGLVSGDPRIYTDTKRNTSEVYGASKAAVLQMTRHFAVHLAPRGIRVNAISPGGVWNRQGEDFVRNYAHRTPMGRMAREDELSGALLFLATDASAYVTGHNLVVDGGWTAW